jgi:hypothetical protein
VERAQHRGLVERREFGAALVDLAMIVRISVQRTAVAPGSNPELSWVDLAQA